MLRSCMRVWLSTSLFLLAACASDPGIRIDTGVPDAEWMKREDEEFCAFQKQHGICDPDCPRDCSAQTPHPYVDGDGKWHRCDPIGQDESPYVGKPGWRNACRSAERMRGIRAEPLREDDGL